LARKKHKNVVSMNDPILEGLGRKQKIFVINYVSNPGITQTQCAQRAGYANAQLDGYRVIRHPKVQAAIKELCETNPHVAGTTEVLEKLTETIRSTSVRPSDQMKAADMLLKVHGAYAPEEKKLTLAGEFDAGTLRKELLDDISS
jgi:phage terminase small subunit